jgi:hypothetical protein
MFANCLSTPCNKSFSLFFDSDLSMFALAAADPEPSDRALPRGEAAVAACETDAGIDDELERNGM